MSLSKEIFMQIRELENKALDGEIDELHAYIECSKIKSMAESSMKNLKQYALSEFEKYGEKTVDAYGCQIQKSQSGRYSYNHLSSWVDLNGQIKAIEKQSQEAYKQSEKGIDLIDENGEIIPPAEYKSNEESLKIKIIK